MEAGKVSPKRIQHTIVILLATAIILQFLLITQLKGLVSYYPAGQFIGVETQGSPAGAFFGVDNVYYVSLVTLGLITLVAIISFASYFVFYRKYITN